MSVIGNDLTLVGEKITIVCQRGLRVDGEVRGNVHGKIVVITERGTVVGTVAAERIEVQGTVRGSLRAVHVTLAATARVSGDILQHSFIVSEGAEFDGQVRRTNDIAKLMPVIDAEVIAGSEASAQA
jgi:cytoskeletal protein CcmA (bactofilin family)